MQHTIYARDGYTRLMSGEGLRPVIRYARRVPVNVVLVTSDALDPIACNAVFYFDDGASCGVRFASWSVLIDWLNARRGWSVNHVRFANPKAFAYANGHPGIAKLRQSGTLVLPPYTR